MIHPRLGMAMRRAIKRGRVIIPGHAKVGPPGTTVDLIYGPLDEGWDLDAFDSTPVLIHDAPRPNEIVLWIGYATGPRVNARCKDPPEGSRRTRRILRQRLTPIPVFSMWGVPGIDHCAALATNGPYFKKIGQTYYMRVWDKECGWISADRVWRGCEHPFDAGSQSQSSGAASGRIAHGQAPKAAVTWPRSRPET